MNTRLTVGDSKTCRYVTRSERIADDEPRPGTRALYRRVVLALRLRRVRLAVADGDADSIVMSQSSFRLNVLCFVSSVSFPRLTTTRSNGSPAELGVIFNTPEPCVIVISLEVPWMTMGSVSAILKLLLGFKG